MSPIDTARVAEVIVRGGNQAAYGSGYRISPHLILTAAHLLGDGKDPACTVLLGGDDTELPATPVWQGTGQDLALLRLDPAAKADPNPHLGTVEPVVLGSLPDGVDSVPFTGVGFPAFAQRPASARAEGLRRRDSRQVDGSVQLGSNMKSGLLDLSFTTAPPAAKGPDGQDPWQGLSGAALFAQHGGLLIGVQAQRLPAAGTGAAEAEPVTAALKDPAFARLLTSEGVRPHAVPIGLPGHEPTNPLQAREFRPPAALLWDYLAAARDGADEHPYATLLTENVEHIPLSTVYVRQEASPTSDGADDDRSRQMSRTKGPAAESVLAADRHVLFTGGAGSGKSSLLRRLTFTAACAWLEDPVQAPPYVPVRVAADQLLDRPFPEALAGAVGRDLPGLRRSLPPELFETSPMPSVDWLVCVDGLDEVLDPDDRGKAIRLIQRWAQEPYLRFAVASRSLVTAEMNRMNALKRYSLLGFGDQQIEEVARAWFEALKVPKAGRRAEQLAAELRQGQLSEAARNPLYLTMICVVAALTDLPRNTAELYGRFLRILRDKGTQRLARSGAAAPGITPELLEKVHEVLPAVAEQRQGRDTRPLLDQVLELLAGRLPDSASKDVVFRALTFTGLVTRRGGDLVFPHHTLQEYLAGYAIADRLSPKDPQALKAVREEIAAERPNIVLFMAARWHERDMPLEEFLRTAVDGGGWRDLLLCAAILSDGLVINEELTARFTRAVIKLYSRSVTVGDLNVPTVLDRLYAVLDAQNLAAVVGDPTVPHRPRIDALKHCVRRGSDQAADLAAELADEQDFPTPLRIAAAELLAEAGERTAACRRLTDLAQNPDQLPAPRFEAAAALLALDRPAGTAVLSDLLKTTDLPELHVESVLKRLHATTDRDARTVLADALAANPVLATAGPHTSRYLTGCLLAPDQPELLEDLCKDPSVPVHLRCKAIGSFPEEENACADTVRDALFSDLLRDPASSNEAVQAAVSGSREVGLIERAARNKQLPTYVRIQAIKRLIELDQHTIAADCADDIPASLASPGEALWVAEILLLAEVLRELGQPSKGRRILLDAVSNPELTANTRLICVTTVITLGTSEAIRDTLSRMAADTGTAAADRLSTLACLHNDMDPAAPGNPFAGFAADDKLPGNVRHRAATQVLNAGQRDTASRLLRRIAEDHLAGMGPRIDALTALAGVDIRAASETLHRILDEPGLLDEHLWQLLDLVDALTPGAPLRGRLDALIEDEDVPATSFLQIETRLHRTEIVPSIRQTLSRIADDPATEPHTRALAAARSVGLLPYPRWKTLMAGLSPDPLHCLSLHVASGGLSPSGIAPGVWGYLSFHRDPEKTTTPTGALAGLDPNAAVAQWIELIAQRRPEAITHLRLLRSLIRSGADRQRVDDLLVSWVEDSKAALTDRLAAAATADRWVGEPWYALARDGSAPPELRAAICEFLPSSGAHNRIPLTRALAANTAYPARARAKAAALLAEDLGDEGRRILRNLSGPHTTDPEAHLAAASAWEKLHIGREAVAAYRHVLDDERADARHRLAAAGALAKWRTLRGRAVQTLKEILGDREAPVAVRVDAAEQLINIRESAEAHLGLLCLALQPELSTDERAHMVDLLPTDLRVCAGA